MFDCFGVLVSELAPVWFASRYERGRAAELKQYFFADADCGKKSIKQLIEEISEKLGIDKDVIIAEWKSIFHINYDLFNFLGQFRIDNPNCDIILVSNAPQGLVEAIFTKYDLEKYFDAVFVSWKYKMAKPNPSFYRLCLEQMQRQYKKILMIDDNPTNLKGISQLGIEPVVYSNNELLIKKIYEEIA